MSAPEVQDPTGRLTATVQTTVLPGDPVGWDPLNRRLDKADPDASANPILAQFVAVEGGNAGAPVRLCRQCVLINPDASWTAGKPLYPSGSGGALTHSYASAGGIRVNAIGFTVSTGLAIIDCSGNLLTPPTAEL